MTKASVKTWDAIINKQHLKTIYKLLLTDTDKVK